jgi:hypothetical protein
MAIRKLYKKKRKERVLKEPALIYFCLLQSNLFFCHHFTEINKAITHSA